LSGCPRDASFLATKPSSAATPVMTRILRKVCFFFGSPLISACSSATFSDASSIVHSTGTSGRSELITEQYFITASSTARSA